MKIAHFSWEYPPAIWGGLGTFAYEITKKQAALGHQVTVFALNDNNALKPHEIMNNIEVFRPRMIDYAPAMKLFSNQDILGWGLHFQFFADVINYNLSSATFFVNEIVKKNKQHYDIIDGHDWLGIIGGITAKHELNLPLMFHVHSTEQGRSLGGGSPTIIDIERTAAEEATAIITVSQAMKEHLKTLGFPEEKLRVCWNGVDPHKYNPEKISKQQIMALRKHYGIKPTDVMLFFIGRLVTVKGIDKLVRAMPDIVHNYPNAKLVVLGMGDLEHQLKHMITEYNIEDNVIIRPEFVSEDDRIKHYAASDVIVLPSLYEPFGIVCTEAMSMAKPVVVGGSGTTGMREQIIPSGTDQCGIHVNPYEPKDIAWGVNAVLETKDLGKTMGQMGRKRVIKEFSWDVVAKKTLAIYEEFVPQKKPKNKTIVTAPVRS